MNDGGGWGGGKLLFTALGREVFLLFSVNSYEFWESYLPGLEAFPFENMDALF